MAKIKLDDKLVESALSNISTAKSQISGVEGEMTSALGLITGARGSEYIDASVLNTGLVAQSDSDEKIDDTVETINSIVSQIKEWNEDVDGMSFLERFFSTGAMIGAKVGEGFLGAGEQLVDGFASLIGWGAGKFGNKDLQDKIGNFIAKDHVGDAFHNFYYNTDIGKRITQGSYMSENGKLAGACKLVGTALGYTAALSVVGLGSSMAASATAAGIGAMGGTMQAGLGAGMSYDEAFKKGLKNAAISAALVVGVSCFVRAVAPHAKNAWNRLTGKGSDLADDAVREAGNMGDDFVENATKGRNGGPTDTNAGFDAGGGPNPKGPTSGPGGSGGSGAGNLADDAFNSLDEVMEAVKRGDITPDQARQFINNKAASAVSKSDKIAWHPDKVEGALRQFENAQSEAVNSAATNLNKNIPGVNEVDDGLNALNKAASPNPAQSGVEKVVADNADEAGGIVKETITSNQGPKVTDTPLDEMTSDVTKKIPGAEDFITQTSDDASGLVKNSVAPKELPAEMPTARAGAPGANSYDDAVEAAFRKSIGQDAESAMMNSVQPKQLPATIPQQAGQILSQSSDDITRAAGMADDVERAITNEAANMTDDLSRVRTEPYDPVAYEKAAQDLNAAEEALKNNALADTTGRGATPGEFADAHANFNQAGDDLLDAARRMEEAWNGPKVETPKQLPAEIPNASAGAPGANSYDDAVEAAFRKSIGQDAESAMMNSVQPKQLPATIPQQAGQILSQSSDDVTRAAGMADDVERAITNEAANMSDDLSRVRTEPYDPVAYEKAAQDFNAAEEALKNNALADTTGRGATPGEFADAHANFNQANDDLLDAARRMEEAWNGPNVETPKQLPAEVPAKEPLALPEHAAGVSDDVERALSTKQLPAETGSTGMSDAEIEAAQKMLNENPVHSSNDPTSIDLAKQRTEFVNRKSSSPMNSRADNTQFNGVSESQQTMESLINEGKALERVSLDDVSALQNEYLQLSRNPVANAERLAQIEQELGSYISTTDGQIVEAYSPQFGKAAGTTTDGGGQYVNSLERSGNASYGAYEKSVDPIKMLELEAQGLSPQEAFLKAGDPQKLINMQSAGDVMSHTDVYKVVDAQLPATIPQGPQLPATVPVKPAVPDGPMLPATVPQGPQLPATVPVKPAVPDGPALPATIPPTGPTLPATIPPTGPTLPATIPPTGPTLPATIPPTGPTLPATIPPTGPTLPATIPPTGPMPPATVPPTGIAPPTGAIPPVVPPTPSTFVAKLPPVTNPGTVPLTSPDLLKRDDLALDPIATPSTTGDPSPSGGTPSGGSPGGGGSSGGGGGGGYTPTPTPGTTSVPTTATPTTAGPTTAAPTTAGPTTAAPTTAGPAPTPAPDPGSEYAPIPDTMTGKKSARDYILPAAIGGVVGAAGLAASHVLRDNDKEYLEEDEEEDEDYNDEYFKDMKEEV